MNMQKIKEALATLTAAIEGEEDTLTLKWTVSKRDMAVLRSICLTTVDVANAVHRNYPGVSTYEAVLALDSLTRAIDYQCT